MACTISHNAPRNYLAARPWSPDFPRQHYYSAATVQPAIAPFTRSITVEPLYCAKQNDGALTTLHTMKCTSRLLCSSPLTEAKPVYSTPVNRPLLPPVTTILTPAERVRVDAAGE